MLAPVLQVLRSLKCHLEITRILFFPP
jgi:hypothetical protein